MAQRGEALFRQLGCSGCHGANAAVHAPKLEGLFGKPVPLAQELVTISRGKELLYNFCEIPQRGW